MKRAAFIVFYMIIFQQAFSQWINNTENNNLIAGNIAYTASASSLTDGEGGSLIFFLKSGNLYGQRITTTGDILWGTVADPVLIATNTGDQPYDAISDDRGGAFLSFVSAGQIYMQHINSAGLVIIPSSGLNVTNTKPDSIKNYNMELGSDGNGGVVVSWLQDNGRDVQLFAQKYDHQGLAKWGTNGVQICITPGFRVSGYGVNDGSGGAIFFFGDTRDDIRGTDHGSLDFLTNTNIYAQRLDSNGMRLWTNAGVPVCTARGHQGNLGNDNSTILPDGNGGAIFIFGDDRNDVFDGGFSTVINLDIYAQKINGDGIAEWPLNGIPVTTTLHNQFLETAIPDNHGGFVATWKNDKESYSEIQTQKINTSGNPSWSTNGITISPSLFNADNSRVIADANGNYIYSFTGTQIKNSIIAQKIDSAGTIPWGSTGILVTNNPNSTPGPSATYGTNMVLGNNSAVIFSWASSLSVTGPTNLYASKLLADGFLASSYVTQADGNWNAPGTWVGGVVPPATAEIFAKHKIVVTTNAECRSLTVQKPAGSVTVNGGIVLNISD